MATHPSVLCLCLVPLPPHPLLHMRLCHVHLQVHIKCQQQKLNTTSHQQSGHACSANATLQDTTPAPAGNKAHSLPPSTLTHTVSPSSLRHTLYTLSLSLLFLLFIPTHSTYSLSFITNAQLETPARLLETTW